MEKQEIKQAEVTGHVVRFSMPRKLFPNGIFLYTKDAAEVNSPIVEKVLAVRGVEKVVVTPRAVTVTFAESIDEEVAAKDVHEILMAIPGAPEALILNPETYSYEKATGAGNEEIMGKLRRLLDEEINPGLAMHGGMVQLVAMKGNIAYLKFGGGCHGCGMVDVTLKEGIAVRVKEVLPEIKEVLDVTDHASGEDPYYSHSSCC